MGRAVPSLVQPTADLTSGDSGKAPEDSNLKLQGVVVPRGPTTTGGTECTIYPRKWGVGGTGLLWHILVYWLQGQHSQGHSWLLPHSKAIPSEPQLSCLLARSEAGGKVEQNWILLYLLRLFTA